MKKILIGAFLSALIVGCNESPYPKGKNYISSNEDIYIHQKDSESFIYYDLQNDVSIEGTLILKDDSIASGHMHIKFASDPKSIPQEISLQNLPGSAKFKCLKCIPSMQDWKLNKS